MRHAIGNHRRDLFLIRRLFGATVGHQFGPAEQPLAAHVTDHPVLVLQRRQVLHQPRAHLQRVVQKALVFDDPHILDCRSGPRGTAAKRRDVAEIGQGIGGVILEHLEHRLGGHRAGNRRVARRHALGHRDEIRLHPVMLIAEPGPGAPDAADHFVDVQQDVVAFADLLHPLPIANRRRDHAAARRHRFQHQRAHRIGTLAQDHLFNRIRRALAVVFHIPLLAVFQAMRHFDKARREGPVLHRALLLACRGQRGDRGAVIIAVAVEDLVLAATVMAMRDLAHHLVDLLVRFRARVGIVDPGEPRHFFDQLLREHRTGDRARRACKIIQLDQLVAHRIGDADPTVAHVDRPHPARHRVKMLAALDVPDPDALAFNHHPRIDGFERFVLDQVVPDMGAVRFDHRSGVVAQNMLAGEVDAGDLDAGDLGGHIRLQNDWRNHRGLRRGRVGPERLRR